MRENHVKHAEERASMKALPKRKGNHHHRARQGVRGGPSMKVPPKRKGNDQRGALCVNPQHPQ